MKLCRFRSNQVGLIRDGAVHDVTEIVRRLPVLTWPFPLGDQLIEHLDSLRSEIGRLADRSAPRSLDDVELLSPIANPGKIIGAAINYSDSATARDQTPPHGHPVKRLVDTGVFLKANSALVGPCEGVEQRFPERPSNYEGELVVVIGKPGTRISRDEAMDHVLGYAVGLDMTVRGPEFPCFRKSIDSFAVVGPWLVTKDQVPDPGNLEIKLWVNGALRQHANTRDLVSDIPRLIEYATSFYSVHPGDLIMTGTPSGTGPTRPGDVIEVDVESVGRMEVHIRSA